ncbi:hypothetical protein BD410DRAFT_846784 [Rickenella mellea]|uniref:Uncharacterized protein n=1 Tax=Rickenella mellea TaxID=50990 RepID=A0A4Y7PGF9_9AGAM|nr:hypothetical protein BD410DRAFT_846784 [Rickenella mellea]
MWTCARTSRRRRVAVDIVASKSPNLFSSRRMRATHRSWSDNLSRRLNVGWGVAVIVPCFADTRRTDFLRVAVSLASSSSSSPLSPAPPSSSLSLSTPTPSSLSLPLAVFFSRFEFLRGGDRLHAFPLPWHTGQR